MTSDQVMEVMIRASWASVEVAGPLLGLGMVVGLIMSLLQAATQISEPSFTFVPKLIALVGGIAYLGSWMLERLTSFSREMFEAIATLGTY